MRILLVTTDGRISQDVRAALTVDADTDIFEVRTPQRALQQLEEAGPWDIVVADNDTAPAGGFVLARDMDARSQMGADIPPLVLLLARPQDRWLANWAGPDAFMLKPLDPFDLLETVTALAAGEPVPELPGVGVPSGALPADLHGIEDVNQVGTPLSAGP